MAEAPAPAPPPGPAAPVPPDRPLRRPQSCTELFRVFNRLALQGFGGVLPIAHRELVERERWLAPQEFVELLALAQVLPGLVDKLTPNGQLPQGGIQDALGALGGLGGLGSGLPCGQPGSQNSARTSSASN